MATVITKSVGATGRDYATYNLAEAAAPASYVTADEQWDFEGYNDAAITETSTITINGTADATRYPRLKPATGEAFNEHADKLTNRLAALQANGVYVTGAISWALMLDITSAYAVIDSMQFKNTHVNGSGGIGQGYNITCKKSIIEAHDNLLGFVAGSGTSIVNCAFVNLNTERAIRFRNWGGASSFINNTVFDANAGSDDLFQFSGSNNAVVKGNVCLGFGTVRGLGTEGAASDYNAFTDATGFGDTNEITSITLADQIESVSGTVYDLRMKSGADGEAACVQYTETDDEDILGQARDTSTPCMGCFEIVSGGSDAEVTATTNALTIASTNATVTAEVDTLVTGTTNALTLTSTNATALLEVDAIVTGTTNALTIASTNTTVLLEVDAVVTGTTNALTISSTNATVTAEANLVVTATTNALTIASTNATISLANDLIVTATTNALTLASTNATVTADATVTATTNALTIASTNATVSTGSNAVVDATTNALTIASTNATAITEVDATVTATTNALTISSTNATVSIGVDLSVTATTNALTIASSNATVTAETDATVTATTNAIVLTAANANVSLESSAVVNATTNALVITPTNAILKLGQTVIVTATTSTLTITPTNAIVDLFRWDAISGSGGTWDDEANDDTIWTDIPETSKTWS